MWDVSGITIAKCFQSILDESRRKTTKIWADKGTEFYSRPAKSYLPGNNIEMHLTHKEGKSKDSLESYKDLLEP